MNSFYESFLRKEIFATSEKRMVAGKLYDDVEVVMDVFESTPKERNYIILVVEDYISSKISAYEARKYLLKNIICPFLRCMKMESERIKQLDEMVNSEDYNRKVAEFVAGARARDGR